MFIRVQNVDMKPVFVGMGVFVAIAASGVLLFFTGIKPQETHWVIKVFETITLVVVYGLGGVLGGICYALTSSLLKALDRITESAQCFVDKVVDGIESEVKKKGAPESLEKLRLLVTAHVRNVREHLSPQSNTSALLIALFAWFGAKALLLFINTGQFKHNGVYTIASIEHGARRQVVGYLLDIVLGKLYIMYYAAIVAVLVLFLIPLIMLAV